MNRYFISLLILFSVPLAGCQTHSGSADIESSFIAATPQVTATLEPSPTATETVLTIHEQVEAFMSGKIDFPGNLSPEDYSAFIKEMNATRGSQPIYVDLLDKSKNPIVWYYDVAENHMVQLQGTYAENKAIIDPNTMDLYVGVLSESGNGNLQFIHPNTGELVTVPDSADMDWDMVIDNTNYKNGVIEWPTTGTSVFGATAAQYFDRIVGGKGPNPDNNINRPNVIPAILMDNGSLNLTRDEGGGQGYGDGLWMEQPAIEMLFVRTDANGKPLYAVKSFVQETYMKLGEEGGDFDFIGIPLDAKWAPNRTEVEQLESGAIYYVALNPNQKDDWDRLNRDEIDQLQNVASETAAYDAAVNDPTPAEQVILTSTFLIKKK